MVSTVTQTALSYDDWPGVFKEKLSREVEAISTPTDRTTLLHRP